MPQPLVSVIMPSFNAGPMLRAAIDSVVRQTYGNIEIVFVDNNSSDGSAETAREILKRSARPFSVTPCLTQGANFARNHGYASVRGDYIQWMDADDELGRDKVALQVAALEQHPSADIAYGDWTSRKFLAKGPPLLLPQPLGQISNHLDRTLAGVWYPLHLYLLRRSAADRLQLQQAFWPGRPVAQDIEYFAIAALLGLRFLHVGGAHVFYNNWSKDQISYSGSYARRTATLREIYKRLQALAETSSVKDELRREHKILLRQNWDTWAMPKGSVEIAKTAGRHVRLRHVATGRELLVRPKEAAIASFLLTDRMARAPLHHATRIAEVLPELRDQHPFIVEVLERFRDAGLLEQVAEVEANDPWK